MQTSKEDKYKHISIPMSMAKDLIKLVGHHGFRNPTEVVMWAIREKWVTIQKWVREIENKKEETGREF